MGKSVVGGKQWQVGASKGVIKWPVPPNTCFSHSMPVPLHSSCPSPPLFLLPAMTEAPGACHPPPLPPPPRLLLNLSHGFSSAFSPTVAWDTEQLSRGQSFSISSPCPARQWRRRQQQQQECWPQPQARAGSRAAATSTAAVWSSGRSGPTCTLSPRP